jgi:hypothetical protein
MGKAPGRMWCKGKRKKRICLARRGQDCHVSCGFASQEGKLLFLRYLQQ